MLKNIITLGKTLNKNDQGEIFGGRALEFDCASHYTFCDNAHPTNHAAFTECMESCGC